MAHSLLVRPSRLRRTPAMRALLRETDLKVTDLIYPLFINHNLVTSSPIASMPGVSQVALAELPETIVTIATLGIRAVMLFGIPIFKDNSGSACLADDGVIQQATRIIKKTVPEILVIADLCLCEYTDHGHCGILQDHVIDNDRTLPVLQKQAISLARAGVQWIAPSGMLDGMVQAIRNALDEYGFKEVAILSYAVKYSSGFYGPFRDAAGGAPAFGDRRTHQMDYGNAREALREAGLDVAEGADMIMVKPAMNYLDIIYRLRSQFVDIPLCAYQVSGEYSMLKTAITNGIMSEETAIMEPLLAIKRAGADLIITYFACEVAKLLGGNHA